jgi:hypothetical protein
MLGDNTNKSKKLITSFTLTMLDNFQFGIFRLSQVLSKD